MDYSKHENITETSSVEIDQSPVRSYECTFCKRGFTNAQALGGHMNIHRKDKAKTKQKDKPTYSFSKPSIKEEYMSSSSYFRPICNDQTYYQLALGAMNYQVYFPLSSPSYPPQAYYQSDLTLVNFGLHKEHLGTNLSPEIGSSHMEDREVDLELRLGYGP